MMTVMDKEESHLLDTKRIMSGNRVKIGLQRNVGQKSLLPPPLAVRHSSGAQPKAWPNGRTVGWLPRNYI